MAASRLMNLVWQLKGKLDSSLPGATGRAKKSISDIGDAASSVSKKISGITKPALKLAAILTGGVFAGGITGMLKLATNAAAAQNALDKTAKKLGISAQALDRWSYAAASSAVPQETFISLTGKLNKTIGEAAQGTKSAQLAFQRAGVSIRDSSGKIKSSDQIMLELSDTFKKMPEGIYKGNLALALFGKSGVDMVPLLEKGRGAIQNLMDEGEKLGIVFSETDRKAAKDLAGGLTALKKAGAGVSMTISRGLIPIISPLVKQFGDWIKSNRELINIKISEVINKISSAINSLMGYLPVLIKNIKSVWNYVDGIAQSMGGWVNILKVLGYSFAAIKIVQFAIGVLSFSKAAYGLGKALFIATSAVVKLGVALLANPIGLVIAGLAALVTAGYFLYKNWDSVTQLLSSSWEWFTGIVTNSWNAVVGSITGAWESVKNYFSGAIGEVVEAFDSGFLNGIELIFTKFNPVMWISKGINSVINYLMGINLADSGKKMIASFGKGLLDHWNNIKKDIIESVTGWLPDWMTGGGGNDVNVPNIPAYANGGLINKPQIAMIGESGDEMVIPLTKPQRGRELLSQAANSLGVSGSSNGAIDSLARISSGGGINNITMPSFSPEITVNVGNNTDVKSITDQFSTTLKTRMDEFNRKMEEYVYQVQRRSVI